jgi:hypothetical protein
MKNNHLSPEDEMLNIEPSNPNVVKDWSVRIEVASPEPVNPEVLSFAEKIGSSINTKQT